ncbi:MAG: hypothetical protein EBT79_13550 [Actinobacteria bacterium]|nr:hypothetical protein [Actinomycetota bacterium]
MAYSRGAAVAMVALGEAHVRPRVLWVAPAWRRGWANVRPPHLNGTILHGDQDSTGFSTRATSPCGRGTRCTSYPTGTTCPS